MAKSFYQYCIENKQTDLLSQWDKLKNRDESPDSVSCFSSKKIWWKCSKGHEWLSPVKVRTHGNNCPVCSGKRLAIGENDLLTTHPELVAEWAYDKNLDISPQAIGAGSEKAVWWRCQHGHEWRTSVVSRCAGRGCPVCAGKVVISGYNDLVTHYPDIAKQWHPTRNGELPPEKLTPYSNHEVWWVCELGHEWKARVSARTKNNSGCPYCARRIILRGFNDLATTHPEIASQWHPFLNGDLTPEDVMSGSRKKIWWKCISGHIWKAFIYSRTGNATGCPVCAGKTNIPYYYIEPADFEHRMMAEINNCKKEN